MIASAVPPPLVSVPVTLRMLTPAAMFAAVNCGSPVVLVVGRMHFVTLSSLHSGATVQLHSAPLHFSIQPLAL